MTILEEKPNNNHYKTATAEAWNNVEWQDDDTLVDTTSGSGRKRRPCFSHGAAKARSIAISRNYAPGWQDRHPKWVRTWLAAVNDPSATVLLQAAIDEAPADDRPAVGTVREYLNLIGTQTSWNAKDPVFPLRKTLAAAMGCDVSTVSRCAMAAERAGLLTDGIQQWWIKTEDDGEQRPVRSSTVRMLVLEGPIAGARKAVAAIKKRRKTVFERREISEAESQQLQAKKAANAAHNAYMQAQAAKAAPVGTPTKPIPNTERTTAAAKIREARQQLE